MTLKEQIIFSTLQIDSELLLTRLFAFIKLLHIEAEVSAVENRHFPAISGLKVYTVEEVNSPSYQHQNPRKEQIVGAWPGDEPIDVLLKMLTK